MYSSQRIEIKIQKAKYLRKHLIYLLWRNND